MSQGYRNGSDNQVKKSGVVYIIRIHAQLLILAFAYFIAAGSLNIGRAWLYFGIAAVTYFVSSLIFIKYNPGLINERAKERENTKSWDKALLSLYLLIGFLGTHIVAGLDSRFEWSSLDMIYMIPGAVLYIVATLIQIISMLANKYFEATVRIQSDREQQVVKDGPYKIVRHPGYASVLLSFVAIPFMIGSLYALICTAAVFIIMFTRTALEDKMLQKELPGYSQYAKEVKFRLIPGIW
ncbi:MAG: isoprenylcysteine carboxylmethyltransferase family protein [Desulfotomaculaceae bacterium]|nr:isoprenylcysteine carboxylmethyltransferase family protein [Desulfotomaculaceae bacterium]